MKLNVSNVYEVKVTEYLRQTSNHRSIASCIVVQFKEGCGHQLVVPWHGEQCLLGEGDQEKTLVLLGTGAVRRHVRILRGLEVGSPPVGNHFLRGHNFFVYMKITNIEL